MAHPVLVAGIVAVLSIGAISVSFEASARPGSPGGPGGPGAGAGRSAGGHFGIHRSRSFSHGRHIHRHGGRHGHLHKPFHSHRKPFHPGKKHGFGDKKHGIGLGLPFAGVGIWDGGPYGFGVPSYAAPADPGPFVSGGGAIGPYRHVCRSDVQVVPATRGGETSVTVTSCYVVPN